MKKEILLALTAHLLLAAALVAPEERVILGGETGFASLAKAEGVVVSAAADGAAHLLLKDLQASANEGTDLLLHFDDNPIRDETSRYEVRNERDSVLVSAGHRMRGKASAAFQRESRLILSPRGDSFFAPGTSWGDFTIEFWMYPATLENGETVFHWRGAGIGASRADIQEFSCAVEDRSLVWRFSGLFRAGGASGGIVELKGGAPLVPRTWRHHALRYDAATGMLEYAVDGRPEDVRYASPTGREDGKPLQARIERGRHGPLVIGENFTGFLDEFRIAGSTPEPREPAAYAAEGGRAETLPEDLGYGGSALTRIDARYKTPSDSAVFFFYQIAETLDGLGAAEWRPFVPGSPLPSGVRGRFVRVGLELYPDGKMTGSPRISEISIGYERNLPPPAPAFAAALPGDGSIELRWSQVPDPNVQGYLVYYGTRPGVYDGNESGLGPSPLHVGRITRIRLEGLQNGKLYYFAVSAYDGRGDYVSGLFSREVSARPSRLYRNESEEKK